MCIIHSYCGTEAHMVTTVSILRLKQWRKLPGGKKDEDECGFLCTKNDEKGAKKDDCVCLGFIPVPTTNFLLYAVINSVVGLVILFRFTFPALYRREEHLPEDAQVVDSKRRISIILTALFGVIGVLIMYFSISSKISSNSIIVLSTRK